MKKLVLVLTVVLVLSGIFAVAALTQVDMERNITVSIATDIHQDVAIRFEEDGYTNVLELQSNGTIEINLANVLALASYYNPEAVFHMGETTEGNGVFRIQNNSGVDIAIDVEANEWNPGGLTIVGADTIISGTGESYAFELDTHGAMSGATIGNETVVVNAKLIITPAPATAP